MYKIVVEANTPRLRTPLLTRCRKHYGGPASYFDEFGSIARRWTDPVHEKQLGKVPSG
ncbi:hypothetical protein [Nocardioides gansuensis]|uniref:hypothetical protein n=1 Tax=Nocardioides gansuensis TaxID=2138300 RepID=UPI0014039A1A|nr:hypothetical protein [Nocardioides gansuensis]